MTRCDDVRRAISARMDETELDAAVLTESVAVDRHLMSCSACAEFEQIALGTRRALRFEDTNHDAGHDAELTDAMLAAIVARAAAPVASAPATRAHRNRWSFVAVVAIFFAGLAAGAVAMRWDGGVPSAVASDRAGLVAAGQTRVAQLRAAITVVERGADEATQQRSDGELTYVAPEAVHLALRSSAGGDRATQVGVNGETAWMVEDATTSVVTGREPFDPSGWSALELVVPVDAFGRDPAAVVETEVDGRPAVLVTTTVAQVEELLDAVRTGSTWRPLHPSDAVRLWLDPSTAVPLRVEVAASLDPDRAAWAARQALLEPLDGPLFVVELHDVVVNAGDVAVPAPPGGARVSLGFVDRAVAPSEVPVPSWLPEAMVEHRSGERRAPGSDRLVVLRTWTTGRSWVKVTATRSWSADRLFGDIGRLVRPVETEAGVLYVSEDGSAVALHADGIDVVVTGSVTEAELQRVAASLGLVGRAIPAWWDEAGARTLDELAGAGVEVLAPATSPDGSAVAYAVDGERVEVSVAGPGARGVRITQRPASVLTPGEDPDAVAVDVRGFEGRFSPTFGEMAWIERGRLVVLSTRTLTLGELTAFAEDLRWFD